MKAAFTLAALAGLAAAAPKPQGVTSAIAPQETTPSGCSKSYDGEFEISIVNVTSSSSKRDLTKRKDLTITLKDGVLIDDEGRTGYIAANNQFQFDKPAQTGAIYTSGWSVCSNGTLALGNSAVFYQCLSGTFYNLYDESTGDQCSEIYIDVVGGTAVSSASDGQLTAASAASQISDGQVQASTSYPAVSQITDGQIQATTGKPAVVTQISDGQIQATTKPAVVTQISDGQIQATTRAAVVSQISDGQIQATTGKPAVVTQISDGQIQATKPAVVTQISDGQIQASAGTGSIIALNATSNVAAASANPTNTVYTGAAALPTIGAGVLAAAGALAMAML